MKNEIYNRTIYPAKDSPDGETSTQIIVTEEVNGYGVFRSDYDGLVLLKWYDCIRADAIEFAVGIVFEARRKKAA